MSLSSQHQAKKSKYSDDNSNDSLRSVISRLEILGQKVMHLTRASASVLALEYMRFMHLKTALDVEDTPSELAPSVAIDELWHIHLTDTRSYATMESILLAKGGRIHHNPVQEEQPNYEKRIENTKKAYFDFFYSEPSADIWDDALVHAARPVPKSDEEFVVFVKTLTGKTTKIELNGQNTLWELKCKLQDKEGVPPDQIRLIFEAKLMEDEHKELVRYGIRNNSKIHWVLRLGGC